MVEVVRTLEDGFKVAWDTTDVSEEIREEFRAAVERQVDAIVRVLDEDGHEHLAVVEAKAGRRGRSSTRARKLAPKGRSTR